MRGVLLAVVYREVDAGEFYRTGPAFIRRDQRWGDRDPADYLACYECTTCPGAWLVWILIVGHAAAALYHHFVLKDRTLAKMGGAVK